MKRRTLFTLAAVALAIASFGAHAQSGEIKIGSVLSVTGPAAFLGDPELKTLQLYVEKHQQAAGGVLGRKLELVHYDDGGEANKANGFAKRLIEDDKVDVIIGGTTTGAHDGDGAAGREGRHAVHLAGGRRGRSSSR